MFRQLQSASSRSSELLRRQGEGDLEWVTPECFKLLEDTNTRDGLSIPRISRCSLFLPLVLLFSLQEHHPFSRRGFQPKSQSERISPNHSRSEISPRAICWPERSLRSWILYDAKSKVERRTDHSAAFPASFWTNDTTRLCGRGRSFWWKTNAPSTTLLEHELTSDLHVAKYGSFASLSKNKFTQHSLRSRHHPLTIPKKD